MLVFTNLLLSYYMEGGVGPWFVGGEVGHRVMRSTKVVLKTIE